MKKIFLILIGSLILASCASNEIANSIDVKQDKIYQNYSILYNGNTNETNIKATYRFGGENGTTLVLTPPSKVTFNGKSMTRYESDFVGAYYKIAQSKSLASGQVCTFVFTDTDKKQYTNSVKFNPVLISKIPAEINKGNPLEFTMLTNALAYGEKISIALKDTTHSVLYEVQDQQPKKQFVLPAMVLKKLSGKVRITITRRYKIMLKEGTDEGGIIYFEYKTKEQEFIIK